jgi:histidine triad (HIT) family protein
MPSIFSRIVKGEIPCAKVWEDGEFLAFLDINPIQPGHTLVIPKKEVDYLFDLQADEYSRLMSACRKLALALKEATGCLRVCVIVAGFEVPHAHVHLIPVAKMEQFPFPPRLKATSEDLRAMAKKVQAAVR